jgi:hypothetical protein
MIRRSVWAVCLVAALGIAIGCHCPTSRVAGAGGPPPPDTVRGLVVVAGANPGVVLLRVTGGAELILLQGPAEGPMHSLESLEIFAAGKIRRGPRGRTLTGVRDFGVVADSGRPVRDGRLQKTGDVYSIVGSSGIATGVSQPPADLQRHVGDRVWLAGVPDAPPTAFGVIPELPPEPAGPANACSPSRIQRGGAR